MASEAAFEDPDAPPSASASVTFLFGGRPRFRGGDGTAHSAEAAGVAPLSDMMGDGSDRQPVCVDGRHNICARLYVACSSMLA